MLAAIMPKWKAYTHGYKFPSNADLIVEEEGVLIKPPLGRPDVEALHRYVKRTGKALEIKPMNLAFLIGFEDFNALLEHRENVRQPHAPDVHLTEDQQVKAGVDVPTATASASIKRGSRRQPQRASRRASSASLKNTSRFDFTVRNGDDSDDDDRSFNAGFDFTEVVPKTPPQKRGIEVLHTLIPDDFTDHSFRKRATRTSSVKRPLQSAVNPRISLHRISGVQWLKRPR